MPSSIASSPSCRANASSSSMLLALRSARSGGGFCRQEVALFREPVIRCELGPQIRQRAAEGDGHTECAFARPYSDDCRHMSLGSIHTSVDHCLAGEEHPQPHCETS
eukprot:TRINITY_DN454_c1_g1_i1.p1 TRINITY_DN454_c1_g1~~TRINITY_DN454_c1_g1_i1.p1  ORF type:complete len:107 (-),score=0.09 TRINITY_DN454_c1_g1_i1:150-470(-)